MQVSVGVVHHLHIGLVEIGSFIGYIGLFALILAYSLKSRPLVAKNHPYIEECLEHHP
jgi:hypothetical protein